MANPVVLRVTKLTTIGSIHGSGQHTWRERQTANADPALRNLNHDWRDVKDAASLAAAVTKRIELATEMADNPVLCLEYLITAKHEAFTEGGGTVDHNKYFRDAVAFLEKRHGAANIVAVNIQRDESTPHLVVYAVPLVETEAKKRRRSVIVGTAPDGSKLRETREFAQAASVRLSAAHYQGTRGKLRGLQTDFADQVGAKHGLVRGIEKSGATHQTIREWYGKLDDVIQDDRLTIRKLVPIPEEPGFMVRGDKRKEMEAARAAAEKANKAARRHNKERMELIQHLSSRGLGAKNDQKRAEKAVEEAKNAENRVLAAEKKTVEMRLAYRSEANKVLGLKAELTQANDAIAELEKRVEGSGIELKSRADQVEALSIERQKLIKELIIQAPVRARELGFIEPEPSESRSYRPGM